jgi:hypothetical protein
MLLARAAAPFLLALLPFAAACAPDTGATELDDTEQADAALGEATLTFGADWSENVSGVLVEGGKLTIAYDDARLASCRGTQGNVPQYAITAHYRLGGEEGSVVVAGLTNGQSPTIELDGSGELELWFEATNKWGCHAWDSDLGQNYRFNVLETASKPNWIGNAASVVSRQTCGDGDPCDGSRVPLENGVRFDTWARQRAAITGIYFDAWEPGVTDFDNADLWKQLDVQAHARWAGQSSFTTSYVSFFRRNGNDARYALSLRELDPFHGYTIADPGNCPEGSLEKSPDGSYVRTHVELYFTVNGKELRPAPGKTYRVDFEDYAAPYAICVD